MLSVLSAYEYSDQMVHFLVFRHKGVFKINTFRLFLSMLVREFPEAYSSKAISVLFGKVFLSFNLNSSGYNWVKFLSQVLFIVYLPPALQ